MSGHSKWSKVKHQKGVADIKKGQIFTKIANAITLAVKQSGGVTDPNLNFRLRLAIEKARLENMPKENINRAIERAKGRSGEGNFEEIIYEGYGPQGVAFLIEAVTDNRFRTTAAIKNILESNGARLAEPGAVTYNFINKGLIKLEGDLNDEILSKVIEAGIEDIEEKDGRIFIYTEGGSLPKIKDYLNKEGIKIEEAEFIKKPLNLIPVKNPEEEERIKSLIKKLEENDDVQKVYTNASFN